MLRGTSATAARSSTERRQARNAWRLASRTGGRAREGRALGGEDLGGIDAEAERAARGGLEELDEEGAGHGLDGGWGAERAEAVLRRADGAGRGDEGGLVLRPRAPRAAERAGWREGERRGVVRGAGGRGELAALRVGAG